MMFEIFIHVFLTILFIEILHMSEINALTTN